MLQNICIINVECSKINVYTDLNIILCLHILKKITLLPINRCNFMFLGIVKSKLNGQCGLHLKLGGLLLVQG